MYSRTLLSRTLVLVGAFTVAALIVRPANAQRLEDGERELETKARPTRLLRVDLFKGAAQADPKDKTHQEAADIAAKEAAYPLYWLTVGNQPPEPGKMNRQVADFKSRLAQMTKFKGATLTFQQMFCRQVMERTQEVTLRSKPVATINAARMLAAIPERPMERGVLQSEKGWVDDVLPRLADGNAEYLAGVALTILETPKMNEGVRYYMFHTLASLLSLPKQPTPLLKKETEEKAVQAAVKQVEKKVPYPKATPRGEVEGYKVLRREAVRVLAAVRVPVMGDKDRVALILARVAGNDQSIEPAPRLDERIAAMIGLARMGTAKFPDYQPDYTVAQITMCVRDFGMQADANTDDAKNPAFKKRPWKVDAARMLEALDELNANVKSAYVQSAVKQCRSVLGEAERGNKTNGNNLVEWLGNNPPPAKGVFKTGEDSTVKPREEK